MILTNGNKTRRMWIHIMKKVPSTSKAKSLLTKTSASDIRQMTSPEVRNWAKANGIATSKEIDGMSLKQLDILYMQYLKAKGQ